MTTTKKSKRPPGNHGGGWRPFGEANPRAKLTSESVRSIRSDLLDGVSVYALAVAHNVSPRAVELVGERKRWAHVA